MYGNTDSQLLDQIAKSFYRMPSFIGLYPIQVCVVMISVITMKPFYGQQDTFVSTLPNETHLLALKKAQKKARMK